MVDKQKTLTKVEALQRIKEAFEKQEVVDRLQQAYLARVRQQNISEEEAFKFIKNIVAGIITTVEEDKGQKTRDGGRKYLWQCTARSIVLAALDAVMTGIPVDNRQLAFLSSYGNQCTYDLMYKGVVYRVQELYENADIDTIIVWPEDHFRITKKDGRVNYEYEPANPFRADYANAAGCFCIIRYTIGGELREREERIADTELKLIRSKAKQDFIWREWLGEKIKVATLRRACKLMSSRNEDVAYMERVLNKQFDMAAPALAAPEEAQSLQRLVDAEKEKRNAKPHGNDTSGEGRVRSVADGSADNAALPDGERNHNDGSTAVHTDNDANNSKEAVKVAEVANKGKATEATAPTTKEEEPSTGQWDRRTIVVKGKPTQKDWKNSLTAAKFLKGRIALFKEPEAKKAILEENNALIGALLQDGFGDFITELHQTMDKGN